MRALTLQKIKDFEWVFCSESFAVMNRELMKVLQTQHGLERVEAFLTCLRGHLSAAAVEHFECEREEMPFGVQELAFSHGIQVLTYYVMGFVEDAHREHMVRCHAQNMPTTYAVYDLIQTYPEFSRLAEDDALGEERLVSLLVHRLAYLKPTSNRWPGTKYSEVWFAARQAYREAQQTLDLPYTSVEERILALSREAERIVERLETGPYTEKEYQTLLDTLQKLFDQLNTMDRQQNRLLDLDNQPQIIGVLERLTLALTSTEGISEEVVEKLKALAPPETDTKSSRY